MNVLQNLQKFGYWCKLTELPQVPGLRRAELTEVPSTGINVLQNFREFLVRVIPGQMHTRVRFEVEDSIQLAWHVFTGPMSPRQSVVALRDYELATKPSPRKAMSRGPQWVATGATAALTATLRCKNRSYHGRTPSVALQIT